MSKPNLATVLTELADMKTANAKTDQTLSVQLEILVSDRERLKRIEHKLDILIARSERRNQHRN
ncbi:MAG TPA: hypothetical protein VHE34_00905 [Puia sp.]|uniref:hypothetical protein n=1 Tax=Puia sp. TaxID=2045100 RepID=UPI002C9D6D0C|nr:hypothetical protein [Puia sp.]HVU93743.1 hypothetical protein [Puia sp.]